MTKVAPRFGLSDVGLSKVCKRYDIPRPPVGYWAKKEFGKAPEQTPLPPIEDESRQKIEFLREEKAKPASVPSVTERVQDEQLKKLIEFERQPENRITVSENPAKYHPIVRDAKTGFSFHFADRQGLYRPSCSKGVARLNISVSKDSHLRALRFMDALIKAMEKRGHRVIAGEKEWRDAEFVILEEKFTFRLRERTKMIRIPEAEHKDSYERVRYEPTGLFELQLWRKAGYREASWNDTARAKLEDQLNSIMIELLVAVEKERDWRRVQEDRVQREQEDQIRRWEEEEARLKEEKKIDELNQMVQNWDQAARIRAFIADVRLTKEQRQGSIDEASDLAKWVEWALKHADKIDPLGAERIRKPDTEPTSDWVTPNQPR